MEGESLTLETEFRDDPLLSLLFHKSFLQKLAEKMEKKLEVPEYQRWSSILRQKFYKTVN